MAFSRFRDHVVFVSAQNVPSYLAAAWPGSEAANLRAIVTDRVAENSRVLEKAWKKRGGRYHEYRLHGMERDEIFSLLSRIAEECGRGNLILNITGGTKLMTLAAYEWACAFKAPAFYIDTENDRIVFPGKSWEYDCLPDILDVAALLLLYGYEIDECIDAPVDGALRETVAAMLDLACASGKGRKALAILNGCAAAAAGRLRSSCSEHCAELSALLAICEKGGKLSRCGNEVVFADEEARKWCNGLWLEDYARMTLCRLKLGGRIRSWATSVQVQKSGVKNELDALFAVRNRLYMIECKTSRMNGEADGKGQGKTASILYKTDSLQDRIGGIFTRSMICSIDKLQAPDMERARSLHIDVCAGADLKNLEEYIARWSGK